VNFFNFDSFISTTVIKIVFGLYVILSILGWLGYTGFAAINQGVAQAAITFIVGAIAVVLYLLNSGAVPEANSLPANLGGLALLVVTGALAANFVREQIAGGLGPLSGVVLAVAVVVLLATVALGGKFLRAVTS